MSPPHPHLVSRATRRGNWETGARPPIKPLNRPNIFLSKPTAQAASNPPTPSTGGGMSRAAGGTGARVSRYGPEPISAGRMRKRLALASLAVCWEIDPWCKVYFVQGKMECKTGISWMHRACGRTASRDVAERPAPAVRRRTQPHPRRKPSTMAGLERTGTTGSCQDLLHASVLSTKVLQACASTRAPATRVSKVRSRQ